MRNTHLLLAGTAGEYLRQTANGKRQTEPRPAAPRLNRQWLYEKDKRDGQRIIEATSPEKTVK